MGEVYLTRPGHDDIRALPSDKQDRIKAKLLEASRAPARYLKRLRGQDLYILRVGDHRVVLDWDRAEDVLYVHAIGHRRNVYDRDL